MRNNIWESVNVFMGNVILCSDGNKYTSTTVVCWLGDGCKRSSIDTHFFQSYKYEGCKYFDLE